LRDKGNSQAPQRKKKEVVFMRPNKSGPLKGREQGSPQGGGGGKTESQREGVYFWYWFGGKKRKNKI